MKKQKSSTSRALRPEDVRLIESVSKAVRRIGLHIPTDGQAASIIAQRRQVASIRERLNADYSDAATNSAKE